MKWNIKFEVLITLIYLLIGVLWILLSDIVVKFLVSDLDALSRIQSFKGVIFVVISSAVIFYIAMHYNRKQIKIKKHLVKARKKAEKNERLKSAFLANLSHEIRTPMNGIIGFVGLLKESDFQNEKHNIYLEHVKKSSERMLETINDIVEISHIESNQVKVKNSAVNVKELLKIVFDSFVPSAESKGLEYSLNDQLNDRISFIKTDKEKVHAILKNFIKNAIKFSDSGAIEMGSFHQDNKLFFYVRDNGIGIPPRIQKMIFERFVQADSSYTRPYEGSGLGLAIAKAYAGLLNGEIWLESEEGKGSTFWFSLDYVPAPVE